MADALTAEQLEHFKCADCGRLVIEDPRDWYMVSMEVWNTYGLGKTSRLNEDGSWTEDEPSGVLCMDDLEKRMGRKLEAGDLYDCMLNTMNPYTRKLIAPNLEEVIVI